MVKGEKEGKGRGQMENTHLPKIEDQLHWFQKILKREKKLEGVKGRGQEKKAKERERKMKEGGTNKGVE